MTKLRIAGRLLHIAPWISLGLVVFCLTPVWAEPEPMPTPVPETGQALRAQGLDAALAGEFQQGLATLRKAGKADTDSSSSAAAKLLEAYVAERDAAGRQQRHEYNYEVDRIRWANVAQKHQTELTAKPYAKKLRRTVNKTLGDAYQAIGTAENFEVATTKEAEAMKATSIKSIAVAEKAVDEAEALLKTDKDWAFAVEFRREADRLRKRLAETKAVWEAVDPKTTRSRWQGARKIGEVESPLADAVTDLEVLVAKRPWRVALLHGRLAKEIAPDPSSVSRELWYIELLRDAEAHGTKAVDQAKWYDALAAYTALEDMEPDNDEYRKALARVRRHVRVLRLYGGKEALELELNDNGDDDEDDEDAGVDVSADDTELWKQLVEGVDARMVRRAISKLGEAYVTNVDYRKLARGALESVKVLIETPQVAETFPALKDEAKRKALLATIDRELADIDKKDRIDHIRLHMSLNNVMYSNEETVNLPLGVLVVEFADGFLQELDRFSGMIWPYDVTNFNKSTMGKFQGIGVQISKEPKKPLKVVAPLLGTPAYKAGIKAGDVILKVDGKPTKNKTVDKLVKEIMGPPGTQVTLTVRRRGLAEPFDVKVDRGNVRIRTVKGWRRHKDGNWSYLLDPDGKIGYIRLTQFTDTTHEHVHAALEDLRAKGVKSLVLDLRGNPGGLLRSATAVADEFLDSGRIVYTSGRQVSRTDIEADRDGLYLPGQGDLVVLVDQNSASAAEILSGALRDWKRAIIVGERTYGKGSVQNVIPVRKDSVGDVDAFLKLTTAYYYLPFGRLLHRKPKSKDWGVDPNVEVKVTPKQLRKWLTLRHKTDLLQEFVPELLDEDLKSQYRADLPLRTAVLLLELQRCQRGEPVSRLVATGSTDKIPS